MTETLTPAIVVPAPLATLTASLFSAEGAMNDAIRSANMDGLHTIAPMALTFAGMVGTFANSNSTLRTKDDKPIVSKIADALGADRTKVGRWLAIGNYAAVDGNTPLTTLARFTDATWTQPVVAVAPGTEPATWSNEITLARFVKWCNVQNPNVTATSDSVIVDDVIMTKKEHADRCAEYVEPTKEAKKETPAVTLPAVDASPEALAAEYSVPRLPAGTPNTGALCAVLASFGPDDRDALAAMVTVDVSDLSPLEMMETIMSCLATMRMMELDAAAEPEVIEPEIIIEPAPKPKARKPKAATAA